MNKYDVLPRGVHSRAYAWRLRECRKGSQAWVAALRTVVAPDIEAAKWIASYLKPHHEFWGWRRYPTMSEEDAMNPESKAHKRAMEQYRLLNAGRDAIDEG